MGHGGSLIDLGLGWVDLVWVVPMVWVGWICFGSRSSGGGSFWPVLVAVGWWGFDMAGLL